MATRSIVVFGAGPGIGNHIAAKFASHSFNNVILLARSKDRLQTDASFITSRVPNAKVSTVSLDLSDLSAVRSTLQKLDTIAPSPEVVFYNAAVIKPAPVLEVPVEEIEKDFRVTTTSLYLVAQHYIPKMQALKKENPSAKPTILVTNSHLPWAPFSGLLSLSLTKASQMNIVQSLAEGVKDVRFGLVHVEGVVSPEEPSRNPNNIAEVAYKHWAEGTELQAHVK
jgi:NAD(P)-dependent dehydrogenase (short-subunit alcohol dehydrogenase family)